MPIGHANARSHWFTMDSDGDGMRTLMVVETDLHLNPSHPGYDKAQVDALVAASRAFMNDEAPHIEALRIIGIRKYDQ